MKCDICGDKTKTRRVQEYHYKECGLPNVFLMNIDVIHCKECAAMSPIIPSVLDLYDKLARAVVLKHLPLTGAEARFLRKQLGFASNRWAAYLGVKPETMSRWEQGTQKIGPQVDSLIRLFYVQIVAEREGKYNPERVSEAIAGVNRRPKNPKAETISVNMATRLIQPAYC